MKTFRLLLTLTAVLATAFLSAQTATTANPDTVCRGVTAEEYYVDKTTGSTYSWWLSGGGVIASSSDTLILVDWDNTPGLDSVYVIETNTYGCVGDTITLAVVRVDPPVADAGADQTIGVCQTATIGPASTDPSYTYSWSTATGLSDSSVANPTVSLPGGTSQTYTLTVTSPYGCTSTDDVTITVEPAPVADAGTDVDICQGSAVTLDGSGSTGSNLSYSWSSTSGFTSSQQNPSDTPNDTTTYTLTVTDQYGCTSSSTVTVSVIPNAVADAGANDTVCEGNTYTLAGSAINQTSVVWSTNGDGSFANGTTLTPVYTPGPNDIVNGTVTLTLTASAPGSCPPHDDDIVITIHPKPTTSPIHHY
ncbi:MAG: PKD domain-containing protein [Bacteroidales bacterium]